MSDKGEGFEFERSKKCCTSKNPDLQECYRLVGGDGKIDMSKCEEANLQYCAENPQDPSCSCRYPYLPQHMRDMTYITPRCSKRLDIMGRNR